MICEGGTGQDSGRRKMEGRPNRALPWLGSCRLASHTLGVGRKGACCSADGAREDDQRAASGLVQINQEIVGVGRVLLFSVVFKTGSRTDGFPGSICTEGVRWVLESERVLAFVMSTSATTRLCVREGKRERESQDQGQGRDQVRRGSRAKRASLQAQKHIKSVKKKKGSRQACARAHGLV